MAQEKYDYDPDDPKESGKISEGLYVSAMPKSPSAPKLTYRYAQKQAMLRGDAPTYFMRKTSKERFKRGTKR